MPEEIRAPNYRRRVVDAELEGLIEGGAAAIALEGAKAVGKTATAAERATEVFLLEDRVTRQLLEADPTRILMGQRVLVDEWQHVPTTWDIVRREVDRGARAGQFFLTGSASTAGADTHTGAGRILKVRMRPMTLMERGVGDARVSVAELLAGTRPALAGERSVDLSAYVDEIVRSGFPAIRELGDRVRRA